MGKKTQGGPCELGKDSMAGVSDRESWRQDSHPSAICPAIWQGWVGFSDKRETLPQHSRQEDLSKTSGPPPSPLTTAWVEMIQRQTGTSRAKRGC